MPLIDGQQLEDGGEAFYRALRLFGGANDYGHSSTRTFIVTTFKTVMVDIAAKGGALSSDQLTTIDSMFYLDLGGIDQIAATLAADPNAGSHAADQITDLIHDVSATPGAPAAVVEAVDRLSSAALAIGGSSAAGAERRDAILAALRAQVPPAELPASPVPPGSSDIAPSDISPPSTAFTPVDCAARLHDGETCYAVSSATLYQKSNRVSRMRYGGFSGNIRLARGISFRSGNYAVDQTRTPKIEQLATGDLCVTNQRLIFLGDTKSLDLPYARLLSCDTEPGLIIVARSNSGFVLFDGLDPTTIEVFEQLSGTSSANREAIERQQATEYQGSLDPVEEPRSAWWRYLLIAAAVIAVTLVIRHLASG